MSQKIQFRRGTDAARQTVVFDLGEPVFTTDTNKFYLGNGTTTGGALAGGNFNSSESYTIVETTSSEITNGTNLLTAVNAAMSKTPYGKPLSSGNQYSVLLHPAVYDLVNSGAVIDNHNINIVGLSNNPRDTIIKRNMDQSTLYGTINLLYNITGNSIRNLHLQAINTGAIGVLAPLYLSAITYPSFENLTLDNLILTSISGNYEDTLLSTKPALVIGGVTLKNAKFNNIKCYGDFLVSKFNLRIGSFWMNNCEVNGEYFRKTFSSSYAQEAKVTNCRFISETGQAFQLEALTKTDKTNVFSNCYFKASGGFFGGTTLTTTKQMNAQFINCEFEGPILTFNGLMKNCIINTTGYTGAAIRNDISSTASLAVPIYQNCLILSNSTAGVPTVSGNPTSSGIFIGCTLNKAIYTGTTGYFPNESIGNVISPYMLQV